MEFYEHALPNDCLDLIFEQKVLKIKLNKLELFNINFKKLSRFISHFYIVYSGF